MCIKFKYNIDYEIFIDEDIFISKFKNHLNESYTLFIDSYKLAIFLKNNPNQTLSGNISNKHFRFKRNRNFQNILFSYAVASGDIYFMNGKTFMNGKIKIPFLVLAFKIFFLIIFSLFSISFLNSGEILISVILMLFALIPFIRMSYDAKKLNEKIREIILTPAPLTCS